MPKLKPAGTSFFEQAPVVVSTEVDMPASRDEVWSAIADNATWTEWFIDCRVCDGTPQVWTETGQTRRIEVSRLKVDERAVELVPFERWVMTLTRTNLLVAKRMVEMLELFDSSTDDEVRTEVRFTAAIEFPALLRPFQNRIAAQFIDAWGPSLEQLNDYIASTR